jgi:arylsulfatase A
VLHNAEGVFAIRQGPWKLVEERSFPAQRDNAWKAEGYNQLYNLALDPRETTNVWDKHPEVVAQLRALLKQYREQGHSRPAMK